MKKRKIHSWRLLSVGFTVLLFLFTTEVVAFNGPNDLDEEEHLNNSYGTIPTLVQAMDDIFVYHDADSNFQNDTTYLRAPIVKFVGSANQFRFTATSSKKLVAGPYQFDVHCVDMVNPLTSEGGDELAKNYHSYTPDDCKTNIAILNDHFVNYNGHHPIKFNYKDLVSWTTVDGLAGVDDFATCVRGATENNYPSIGSGCHSSIYETDTDSDPDTVGGCFDYYESSSLRDEDALNFFIIDRRGDACARSHNSFSLYDPNDAIPGVMIDVVRMGEFNESCTGDFFGEAQAHEMGHAFGLGHVCWDGFTDWDSSTPFGNETLWCTDDYPPDVNDDEPVGDPYDNNYSNIMASDTNSCMHDKCSCGYFSRPPGDSDMDRYDDNDGISNGFRFENFSDCSAMTCQEQTYYDSNPPGDRNPEWTYSQMEIIMYNAQRYFEAFN